MSIHASSGVPASSEIPAVERQSVFSRLSTDGSSGVKSFAAVVGNKSNAGLTFFPLEDKKAFTVSIPLELAKEAAKSFNTTIVGYFLGSRIPFPIVTRFLKQVWSKHGVSDIMMNAKGFFFIKFNDEGGSIRAMEEGMVMIRGVPMFLSPWDPSKGLVKPSHETCPLWVKFHNVPLVLFNHEGISRISSAIGVPKYMDTCTATMCDAKWGRPGFAKVLIDVWAVGDLKRKIEVKIPHIHDDGYDNVSIDVEYLWEPSQCSHCCVFGHKRNSCTKAPVLKSNDKRHKEVDDEGFVMVGKKQWRKKLDNNQDKPLQGSTSGTKEGPEILNAGVDLNKEMIAQPTEKSMGEGATVENEKDSGSATKEDVLVDNMVTNKSVNALDGQEVEVLHSDASPVEKNVSTNTVAPMINVTPFREERGPQMGANPSVPPKPPIKGILKNPNRFSSLGGTSEQKKESRDESNVKKRSSDDKGGKSSVTTVSSDLQVNLRVQSLYSISVG
ncbi:hypothetical protein OSB04_un000151 [Centaurea solstitialis]|uniref:DUF4283 domain-containing protein n=1 Tax=Centaurea solstitialis TaxID=347529 RepID=A0AA38SR09_9ASTR|nr:hypothetical protein OSB04_un000151 [Centaurea solstitialis]